MSEVEAEHGCVFAYLTSVEGVQYCCKDAASLMSAFRPMQLGLGEVGQTEWGPGRGG